MSNGKWLYAVLGGCVGAILTLVMCSFTPLGTQAQSDGEFAKITCTELEVVSVDGTRVVQLLGDQDGGIIAVLGKDGKVKAGMSGTKDVGRVNVYGRDGIGSMMDGNKHGGRVSVFGKGSGDSLALMSVAKSGIGGVSTWDKNGNRLAYLK